MTSEDFDQAVEELTKALAHHLDEEERTILNPPAPGSTPRSRLSWAAFAAERNHHLDQGAGKPDNLRRLIAAERSRP